MNDDFNSKIDMIQDKLIDDVITAKIEWGRQARIHKRDKSAVTGFSIYQEELRRVCAESKASIISLIKSDIVGADDPDDHEITPGFFYNGLRAKQRAILDGGKKK